EQPQQGALSAAGRPHDRRKLSSRNLEIDPFEYVHTVRAGIDGFGKPADLDQPLLWQQVRKLCILAILAASGCGKTDEPAPPGSPWRSPKSPRSCSSN